MIVSLSVSTTNVALLDKGARTEESNLDQAMLNGDINKGVTLFKHCITVRLPQTYVIGSIR